MCSYQSTHIHTDTNAHTHKSIPYNRWFGCSCVVLRCATPYFMHAVWVCSLCMLSQSFSLSFFIDKIVRSCSRSLVSMAVLLHHGIIMHFEKNCNLQISIWITDDCWGFQYFFSIIYQVLHTVWPITVWRYVLPASQLFVYMFVYFKLNRYFLPKCCIFSLCFNRKNHKFFQMIDTMHTHMKLWFCW